MPSAPLETAAGSPSAEFVLAFWRQLWALDHALQTRSKAMAAELGVTGPQRLVIRLIGLRPGASAGELASTLHLHPSTLTGVLQRLEASRLVQRLGDARDNRRSLFRLTRKGAIVNRQHAGTIEAAVRRTLTLRPETEVRAGMRVFEVLAEQLVRGAAANRAPAGSAKPKARRPRAGTTRPR